MHEDSVYGIDAGAYYPRRPADDENFVSIEMARQFCNKNADDREMVSIAGMYTERHQADSVTSLLINKIPTVKTIQCEVYMGCMH